MDRHSIFFVIIVGILIAYLDDHGYTTLALMTASAITAIMCYNNISFYTLITNVIYQSTVSPPTIIDQSEGVILVQSSPQSVNMDVVGVQVLSGLGSLINGLSVLINQEVKNSAAIGNHQSMRQLQSTVSEVEQD